MRLLLYSRTKLEQVIGNLLVGSLEDIDQRSRKALVMLGEECNSQATLASAPSSGNVSIKASLMQWIELTCLCDEHSRRRSGEMCS